jgi:jmjN domain
MQPLTSMDVMFRLEAAEASHSVPKPLLEGKPNNPAGNAAAEAGPPLTPLGQVQPQQAAIEASPQLEKQPRQALIGRTQNGKASAMLPALAASAAAAAATQQPTARVAPPRSAAPPSQPPAPRQNPIITNAMSAVEENGPWLRKIPSVPVYTPTAEEWKDPIAYIQSIQPEAGKYGACVVKAPITPAVPAALLLKDLRFTTRLQKVKDDPWGKTWEDGIKFWDSGRKCTVLEYAKSADEFARKKLGLAAELPTATVESMYWREKEVTRPGKESTVEYGNDIEGSAFHPQDPLGQTKWNLNVGSVFK